MSEETDAPQGGAEGVDAPAAVETNPEATTEQPESGADNPELADDAGDEPKPKQVPWFQKRIDELTAKRHDSDREAAYWRGKAESAPAQAPATQPEPLRRPTLEQFDYDEAAHGEALDKFYETKAEQAVERKLEQREAAQALAARIETAQSRLEGGPQKHADFNLVTDDIPATAAIREMLAESENAADIIYELGKNGDVAAFALLTPYRQAIELGKISARLSPAQPTSQKPIPPMPPETVAGLSAGLNKTADQMSYTEFVAMREEQEKARN